MATHFSILAWRIPWTQEPGGLQSMGLQESDTTERLHFHNYNNFVLNCSCCLVAKSHPTLCEPIDCSPQGSSVHGMSQARIPEWVAVSFSRGSA